MFKAISTYFLFAAASSAVGLLTVPYLSRTLTPEEYGQIGLFLSIAYFTAPAVGLFCAGLVGIQKTNLEQRDYFSFRAEYLKLSFIAFLVLQCVGLLFANLFPGYSMIFLYAPSISYVRVISSCIQSEMILEGKARSFGIMSLSAAVVTLALTIIFISLLKLPWHSRFAALLVAESAIVTILYARVIKQSLSSSVTKVGLLTCAKYGAPMAGAVFAGWALNQADRFILLKWFSLREVGIFTVGYQIGMCMDLVNTAVINAINPAVFAALREQRGKRGFSKYLGGYCGFVLVEASLFSLICYFGLPWLLGDEYLASRKVVILISFALAFSGMYRLPNLVLEYYKKNTMRLFLVVVSGSISVCVTLSLIGTVGLYAPAVGALIAYVVLFAGSLVCAGYVLGRQEADGA